MDEPPTYLSLFAGIGGLDLAVEAFGFRCVGQVEWDKSCTAVLERHWPDVPRWGDARWFHGPLAHNYRPGKERDIWCRTDPAEPIDSCPDCIAADTDWARSQGEQPTQRHNSPDLIIGGFPCQPFSTAGRREGKSDDRYLWPEFARIIGELRPRMVLVENVPGLLSLRRPLAGAAGEPVWDYAFGDILRDLSQMGFDARWASVRASDAGAPHKRERIFILATNQTRGGEDADHTTR